MNNIRPVFACVLCMAGALVTDEPALAGDDDVLPSVRSRADHPGPLRPVGVPSDDELEAAHARVGTVTVDPRNVFDTSRREEDTALFRLADRLHIRTRVPAVRDQLLFHPGELYQRRLIEESERILRSARYMREPSIRPVAYHDGVVDMEVVTHDVWTLNPGVSFGRAGGSNSTGFELEELNLLGTGSQLGMGHSSDVDRTSTTLKYVDPQLFGSWWRMSAEYSGNSDGKTEEATLEHPFYALDTRRALGLSVHRYERIDSLYDLGEVTDQFGRRERGVTVFGGGSGGLQKGWARRLTAGFTYDDSEFFSIDGEAGPTTVLPANRKLAYPWIGYEWIQDEFETARNRDQIEKTEDIQLGLRAQAQIGYASPSFGADRSALIFKGSVSRGFEPGQRHRILVSSSIAGRSEEGGVADLLAGVSARYYFRQSERRLLFLSAIGDIARNPDLDHALLLGGDNGLRGYPLRYQSGEGRWIMTAEQRFFTDWYPFRLFNVGGAVFYDMGGTWGRGPVGSSSLGTLKDIGFGLRLGNSRSALGNVLHLDLAFPLDGEKSISKVQFLVQTQRSF